MQNFSRSIEQTKLRTTGCEGKFVASLTFFLEIVRIGICQSWKLSDLELVRIGNCQNRTRRYKGGLK